MTELGASLVEEEKPSPGAILAGRRIERNLSLAEIAQRLKYGVRQIEALERDDFEKLPGSTFVRGMIRSYAKVLNIDPVVVLAEFDRRQLPNKESVNVRAIGFPFPEGNKRATSLYRVLSILAIVSAAAIIYEWHFGGGLDPLPKTTKLSDAVDRQSSSDMQPQLREKDNFGIGADSANPITDVSPGGGASALAAEAITTDAPRVLDLNVSSGPVNKRISLRFDRDAWVEIKQADGRILLSQLNSGGSRQQIEGTPPFLLVIGNASNVHLMYGEWQVDLRPYFKVDVARLVLE